MKHTAEKKKTKRWSFFKKGDKVWNGSQITISFIKETVRSDDQHPDDMSIPNEGKLVWISQKEHQQQKYEMTSLNIYYYYLKYLR